MSTQTIQPTKKTFDYKQCALCTYITKNRLERFCPQCGTHLTIFYKQIQLSPVVPEISIILPKQKPVHKKRKQQRKGIKGKLFALGLLVITIISAIINPAATLSIVVATIILGSCIMS